MSSLLTCPRGRIGEMTKGRPPRLGGVAVELAGLRQLLLPLRRQSDGIGRAGHAARPELAPRDLIFGLSFFFPDLRGHGATSKRPVDAAEQPAQPERDGDS